MSQITTEYVEIRHFHMCCGLGGGAKGFNQGTARLGNRVARYRCIGGIDVSRAAIADFERLSGVHGTVLDLFDREQYSAFHGKQPPKDWREATPADIQRAAGYEHPHVVFGSFPCKGFSGLLSEARSQSDKYQALNRLTVRGIWLMLEAFADDPPELILFENVPRIATRGRALLDRITSLLRHYGYATAETTHDCGELGRLAQSRKRFLMVARHVEKVPPFLYEPPKHRLRAVADPRPDNQRQYAHIYRVVQWDKPCATVITRQQPSDGAISVADPRHNGSPKFNNCFRTVEWRETSPAVTGGGAPSAGGLAVADPRPGFQNCTHTNILHVTDWQSNSRTATGSNHPSGGALAVADPRPGFDRGKGEDYESAGHYGVVPWDSACGAISGAAAHDNGSWSVADPRLPQAGEKLIACIISLDNTWHRPFTTLELAALQSLVEPEEYLELEGLSDSAWRERIGNAVPPEAARAIADMMAETLLLAWSGEKFVLSSLPIWVRNVGVALSMSDSRSEAE